MLTRAAGIFSISLLAEYIFIFLITDSLPESLALYQKLIMGAVVIFTFLIVLNHATEGTRVGIWTSNILNKYFWQQPMPTPVFPFSEQLEKLRKIRDSIMTGDKQYINNAFQSFFEIGSSFLTSIGGIHSNNEDDIKVIQTAYDRCKKDFLDMNKLQQLSDETKAKIAGSISEFIGTIDGFTKKN